MNTVADIILGTVRAQVCGQQYYVDNEISDDVMDEIYRLSKAHDVVHIVAAELIAQKAIRKQEIIEKFKKQQILAIYRYERINYELKQICRVLDETNIPYMPLKGAVMRQYYPEPWMRTSADIDILVKPEDADVTAARLVQSLGYRNDGIDEHDIQMFAPSGVHLELHFETIEDYRLPKANEVLKNMWNEHVVCIKDQHCSMSNEMFYFYHVAHMAKHFKGSGCGIRFFLDMWLLNHRVEYDQRKKNALLQAGELLTFAQHAESLAEVWFGEKSHTEITKKMEQYILNGGVYGSLENAMAVESVAYGGRFGHAKYLVFRPFHALRRQYRILYKHKWLFPFCQIHRWIRLIFTGISRAKRTLRRSANAYTKSGDDVEQMLRDLKLTNKKSK